MYKIETDIVVVGGGIAGFSAAMAASESNKVILIDRNSLLGGDSTNANVGTFCGTHLRSSTAAKVVGYNFTKTFLKLLNDVCEHATPQVHHEGLYIIPYEWKALQELYVAQLNKNNVEVRLSTTLLHVNVSKNRITNLVVKNEKDELEIKCDSVIDCSGNAIVSQLAGIETINESSYQAASQVFRINNIAANNEYTLNMAIKRAVLRKASEMNWPSSYASLSVVPGSLRDNNADFKLTLPEVITDDIEKNKTISDEGRKRVKDVYAVLHSDIESFEHAKLEMIFPQTGIRVQQRSKGKYILTEQDILTNKQFDDSIAIGTWPIEEWDVGGSLKMEYFAEEGYYTIPARCLISHQIGNLFFAGKNISATARAIASARVMGTGMQTGYAAGKIACAKNVQEYTNIIASLHHELSGS